MWQLDVQESTTELGHQAFGPFWKGSTSDWTALEAIDVWENNCRAAKLPSNFRRIFAAVKDVGIVRSIISELKKLTSQYFDRVVEVFRGLQLNCQDAFGVNDARLIPLPELRSRLEGLAN